VNILRERKRVLVTALDSFTGHYLDSELRAKGYEVVGTSRTGKRGLKRLDVTDLPAVKACVDSVSPDYVINLAGISFPGQDRRDQFHRVNVIGARNVAQSCFEATKRPRKCIFASSATVYPGSEAPVAAFEDDRLSACNEYGKSKLEMEEILQTIDAKMDISIVRPFNYTGPGQNERFVVSKIAGHFRRRSEEIILGNTSVCRDFCDVRDIASWYSGLLEVGEPFTTNLCRGFGYSLDHLISVFESITGHRMIIRRAAEFERKNEPLCLVGSPKRLQKLLGELRPISLEKTLLDMLTNNI